MLLRSAGRDHLVAEDVVVSEAENAVAACAKELVPRWIPRRRVVTAVGFDHQHGLVAEEVGKERADRSLPWELRAAEPAISEKLPQNPLGRRASPAQTTRPHRGRSKKSHPPLST